MSIPFRKSTVTPDGWVTITDIVENEIDLRSKTVPFAATEVVAFPFMPEFYGPEVPDNIQFCRADFDVLTAYKVTYSPTEVVEVDEKRKVRFLREVKTTVLWSYLWLKGAERP